MKITMALAQEHQIQHIWNHTFYETHKEMSENSELS